MYILLYKKLPTIFPKWLCHFIPASAIFEILVCSAFLLAFGIISFLVFFLNFGQSGGVNVKRYFIVILVCFSLMTNDLGHLFVGLLAIHLSFFA